MLLAPGSFYLGLTLQLGISELTRNSTRDFTGSQRRTQPGAEYAQNSVLAVGEFPSYWEITSLTWLPSDHSNYNNSYYSCYSYYSHHSSYSYYSY